MEYTMSKITINETVFDGESVLRAVRQITPHCDGLSKATVLRRRQGYWRVHL